ncbi:hypothetical protein BKG71_23165 [Mycobacteroides chelonae]|uniref:hypothetical protein n=1 Tax=Mycobacteroides chelonae TaxID=1774 RepID=UPI0008A9CA49|nr:hypothetical protein [Mycobacteroides chelonae]OHT95591.1 hypothetical protein BKG71_23165 [Mycobacteroides chelonae]
MTTYAPAPSDRWISATELAHASGLTEDLVRRFVPANTSGPAPLYSEAQVPLARHIKNLTELGTPAAAVDTAVRELRDNPTAQEQLNHTTATTARTRRNKAAAIAGAAAAAALIIGGVVGAVIGTSTSKPASAPIAEAPITITAPAPALTATVPTVADPICAQWGPMATDYANKMASWSRTDPNVRASNWSPEERALQLSIVPVLKSDAADMNSLAAKTDNPALKYLLQQQAVYEKLYAERLPNYEPADDELWQAARSFSSSVRGLCMALAPR